MHANLAPHADAIKALCQRLGVKRLELFGSAAAGGFEPGRSDYDFLIELDPLAAGSRAQRIIDLAEALEAVLRAPVDLVNPHYIRNPFFAAEVERTRTPVYGRSAAKTSVRRIECDHRSAVICLGREL